MLETIILTNQVCFIIIIALAVFAGGLLAFNLVMESQIPPAIGFLAGIFIFFLCCNFIGLVWYVLGVVLKIFLTGIFIN